MQSKSKDLLSKTAEINSHRNTSLTIRHYYEYMKNYYVYMLYGKEKRS